MYLPFVGTGGILEGCDHFHSIKMSHVKARSGCCKICSQNSGRYSSVLFMNVEELRKIFSKAEINLNISFL